MLNRKTVTFALLFSLSFSTCVLAKIAGEEVYEAPKEVIDRIKAEGMGNNTKVMETMSYLTDVIGGRLTNSPNMKLANEWTRKTMAKWGLQDAHLEAWGPFGRGWSLEEFSAHLISPRFHPLIAYPKAWSPSTPGEVSGRVIHVDIKKEEDFARYAGKLKGAIVLMSNARQIDPGFEGTAKRFTDSQLLKFANEPVPSGSVRSEANATPKQIQAYVDRNAFIVKRMNFLLNEGVAVLVSNSAKGSNGTVAVTSASVAGSVPKTIQQILGKKRAVLKPYDKDAEGQMIPQIVIASADYNRLVRMIKNGVEPELKINIRTRYHDDDPMGYNTIAEIAGTDPKLKDEIVMLGGHLDSWHAADGATDNAAGCAAAMEAVRILMALNLKPRRTIRVALWSGEEQGLRGSTAYVKEHFGEMKGSGGPFAALLGLSRGTLVKKADYEKFSAYYNMDNGAGKFRGIYLQGNPAALRIFRTWLLPFEEMGTSTISLGNTDGTDHISFDEIGLPGFQFIQDPLDYMPLTHHSNEDNFDRVLAKDLQQNATIMAAFVYQTAMMDEKIPRKRVD